MMMGDVDAVDVSPPDGVAVVIGPDGTPLWRDPLSLSFRAHRQMLLLRLQWHGRREQTRPGRTRSRRRGARRLHRP